MDSITELTSENFHTVVAQSDLTVVLFYLKCKAPVGCVSCISLQTFQLVKQQSTFSCYFNEQNIVCVLGTKHRIYYIYIICRGNTFFAELSSNLVIFYDFYFYVLALFHICALMLCV